MECKAALQAISVTWLARLSIWLKFRFSAETMDATKSGPEPLRLRDRSRCASRGLSVSKSSSPSYPARNDSSTRGFMSLLLFVSKSSQPCTAMYSASGSDILWQRASSGRSRPEVSREFLQEPHVAIGVTESGILHPLHVPNLAYFKPPFHERFTSLV